MATVQKPPITLIGAGLAGCFLAILLAKRGYKVEIYERASQADITDIASKRSFNITIYGYAVQVLKEAGLWDVISPNILTLKGSYTQVRKNAEPIYAAMDEEKTPYYSVQRARLLEILVRQAMKHPLITIHFDTSLLAIDRYEKTMVIRNDKTNKVSQVTCNVIFGADGANSAVRSFIQMGQQSEHTQEYATWSYKQIMFPKASLKKLNLDDRTAYTWSRKDAVILSFPNKDGSRAAFMTLPKEKGKDYAALNSATAIKRLITDQFPDLLPALPAITDSLLQNPEGNFVTIHTNPWFYKDFMVIVGDAAHAFNPFFGQGTSAAFGDCLTLVGLMDKYGTDWEKIFPRYQEARKKHMDILGDLSKKGFSRYRRHKRADYEIIYEHFDMVLHKILPQYFQPSIYEQITKNPGQTAEIMDQHQKQRKMTKIIGGSILVAAVTGAVALQEKLTAKKI